jgi:anthranilate phosphoribosyltransferase
MLRVEAPEGAIDLCGTGGDGAHTLNVSTAAAFVVASLGVVVAKHGNRAASSRSGAADVLGALGVPVDLPPERQRAALEEVGIAFLHAQRHHPAMARVAGVRRRIGIRTIFNLLGPLSNPAGVTRQMVGIAAGELVGVQAEALRVLGAEAAVVVHGGGLDEMALHADSRLVWLRGGTAHEAAFKPPEAMRAPLEAIRGGSAEENAAALEALFAGAGATAYADIVCLNAACALKLVGRAARWDEGLALARGAIASGAARDVLARSRAFR